MDRAYEGDKTHLLAINRGYIPVVPPKRNRKSPYDIYFPLIKEYTSAEKSGNDNCRDQPRTGFSMIGIETPEFYRERRQGAEKEFVIFK